MAKRGRPKTQTTSGVVSARIDSGVLNEIDRLLAFRFNTPLGREIYIKMILYGDEPSIHSALEIGEFTRLDFRILDSSLKEIENLRNADNRSEYIRKIIGGKAPPLKIPEQT